jgi:hypothetical protein
LQFDRAEFTPPPPPPGAGGEATMTPQPGVRTCAACQNALTGNYYAAGEHVFCPPCRDQILASMTGGSAARRLFRALAFGVLAGLAGALLWYAVRKGTGYQVGLIAVVVGWAVGAAVRKGSDGRGGVAYQLLAVLVTYCGVALNFVPDFYTLYANEHADWPTTLLVLAAIIEAVIYPVMGSGIIGILIVGFALWEAWRINKYQPITFSGPFTIAGAGGVTPPPPPLQPPPAPEKSYEPPPPTPPSNTPPAPPPPQQLGMS